MTIDEVKKQRASRLAIGVAAMCMLAVLAGCSTTQQAAVNPSAARSGLVDYSRLTPGSGGQADLRWINPDARWSSYRAVLINPVSYWGDADDANISAADQQTLTNYFHQVLYQQLGQKFQIADAPGPGVMRVQVAIVDAAAATPGLRTISVLEPHVRALATLQYLATGTFPFIGGAQVEARVSDAQTGRSLAEWVDRRLGGGGLEAGLQWQWGDAENSMTQWAADAATELSALKAGTAS